MSAEAPPKPRRKHFHSKDLREARTGIAFVTPFILAFFLVFLIPIFVSIRQSFFRKLPSGGGVYGGGELEDTFVGMVNYQEVVTNTHFWDGIGRVEIGRASCRERV